jgi:hypothetical protein
VQRVSRSLKWGTSFLGAALLLGGVMASGSSAQVAGLPDVVGQWTQPFEEGGANTPRCQPAQGDTEGFTVCKPVAQASAVLPDGRIFYYNGIESQENASGPSAFSLSPSSRDSQVRVLDLRSGTPQWIVPAQDRGGQTNPNIKPGHKSYDDPVGAVGVPGRPGDGLVGSLAGQAGVPPHDPTSSPDDKQKNDGDMFCGDLTSLADGRVLISGGTDWYNEPAVLDRANGDPADVGVIELEGLRTANLFDPKTNSFTSAQPMKYGRWYPTQVEMPDGKVTIVSGVTQLISDTQLSQVRRTETFDPKTNSWTENYAGPQSENTLPLQARMFLAPNGKLFYTGIGQMWGPFGQAADEALYALQQYFDPKTKAWEVTGTGPFGARDGAFVAPLTMTPPYDKLQLLAFGGTLGPPPASEMALPISTITTLGANGDVTNEVTGNLTHPRWFSSGIVLPDGQIMAVGGADKNEVIDPGTEIAVHTPELYNPQTKTWTPVADHTRDRTYHNSALLLPDMRVLLGGHGPIGAHYGGTQKDVGKPFANNDKDSSFEVWSPPYLFRGARPNISHAPAGVDWNQHFTVNTPQANDIDSVLLMKTPSPQHVNDPDQRSLALAFNKTGANSLEVTAPPTGIVAPPGNYYLVVNKKTDKGTVPSVARIVSVGVGANNGEALQPYPDDNPAAPAGGSATPDADTSNAASAQKSAGEAAKSAPAPAAGPATAATDAASKAYQQLQSVPASSSAPARGLPVLPAAAIGVTGTALLSGRRWLRRAVRA